MSVQDDCGATQNMSVPYLWKVAYHLHTKYHLTFNKDEISPIKSMYLTLLMSCGVLVSRVSGLSKMSGWFCSKYFRVKLSQSYSRKRLPISVTSSPTLKSWGEKYSFTSWGETSRTLLGNGSELRKREKFKNSVIYCAHTSINTKSNKTEAGC